VTDRAAFSPSPLAGEGAERSEAGEGAWTKRAAPLTLPLPCNGPLPLPRRGEGLQEGPMKDVLKIIVAIVVIVIVWKILKGLIGLLVGLVVAGLIIYGGVKLVESMGQKRIK
jgi:hypothetical protein